MYLGFLILEWCNILMYQFRYEYIKPKYSKKAKCYYIHKNRLYLQRFCKRCWKKIWHCKLWIRMQFNWKAITKVKNKKVMKDELGGKIIIKFVGWRAKTCSYLIVDVSEENKAKRTKKCVIKRKLKFENLFNSSSTWK